MAQISDELIIRFINNTCTDEELVEVKNWLDESDENVIRLFEAEQMAMLASSMRNDDAAKKRVSDKIRERIDNEEKRIQHRVRLSVFRWVSGIAAMIAIVFGLGFYFFSRPEVRMIHIAATDKSITVTLPDSSVVWLNRNSGLTYPEHFADNNREVKLSGEGFFKVTRDKNRPFHVEGKYLDVEVLGTQFNFISNDSIENSVSLIEGSVEVSVNGTDQEIVLKPGQKATYSTSTGLLSVQTANTAIDAAWHDRTIPFSNANLSEIIAILNQLYDVEIEADRRLNTTKTYSGVTVYYEEVDSTLAYLSHTLPIKFKRKGKKIIIMPR